MPAEHKLASSAISLVHHELLDDAEIKAAIIALGIQPVSAELELQSIVDSGFARWVDSDWERFWELVRRCEPARAVDILSGRGPDGVITHAGIREQLRFRTVAGTFQQTRSVLLPGTIVPDDGGRDAELAVDTKFHRTELPVLVGVGLANTPTPSRGLFDAEVFRQYRFDCIQQYFNSLSSSARPDYDYLVFEQKSFTGPLEPLLKLSDEGKARFTAALLAADTDLQEWSLKHRTRAEYPVAKFEPPTVWAAKRFGHVMTSLGPRRLSEAVGPGLSSWSFAFPVADLPEAAAKQLGLAETFESISKPQWNGAIRQSLSLNDDEQIGRFYATAVQHMHEPPPLVRARRGQKFGDLPPAEITVCHLVNEYRALLRIEQPLILVADQEAERLLVQTWGCRPAAGTVRTQLTHIATGSAVPLIDQFPALRGRVKPELESLLLVPCSEVRQETLTERGKTSEPKEFWSEDSNIFWVEQLGVHGLLDRLGERLDLQLTPEDREAILQQRADLERRQTILGIRSQTSDDARLLKAVGEAAIRPRLPAALVESVEKIHGQLTPERLAGLAIVVYGANVLQEFRIELEQAGLQPPQKWAGSRAARKFVSDLGFSREYAGYEEARRDPILMVDGPSGLPPLHEYQAKITQRIGKLLDSKSDDRRGLLSLPTGAGKTRVAVQALVDALREGTLASPVLWVAQSDELCEQAVQSWRDVWRSVGAERQLQVSRLWAQNEAAEPEDAPQVVVATIQKLGHCIQDASYAWLSKASVLIIDEAHGAIAPMYTDLLLWAGIDRKATRCPLIGLTATPFRGRSVEETERLAGRFGRTRLDHDMGQDPYRHLQDIGVLSHVEHRVLEGMRLTLSQAELDELVKLRQVPSSVYDRIAGNVDRNASLLRDISTLPRHWPTLLFAASVEHAQTMAALMTMQGIKSAPITANTEPGARRQFIDAFKRGKIQVLTNYGVLTQGFDAPATRAIYVARPTFSPNLYQQMIGRGLRGPLNGGKEKCLIVNVQDNFAQYGEQLAFREFEYLWNRDV